MGKGESKAAYHFGLATKMQRNAAKEETQSKINAMGSDVMSNTPKKVVTTVGAKIRASGAWFKSKCSNGWKRTKRVCGAIKTSVVKGASTAWFFAKDKFAILACNTVNLVTFRTPFNLVK